MELISRQQAIDEGMSYINGDCFCDKEDFAKYIEFIEQLPSIQPDIVRCEECKYHLQRNCPIEKYFSLDGFCSRGKKREVTIWQMR